MFRRRTSAFSRQNPSNFNFRWPITHPNSIPIKAPFWRGRYPFRAFERHTHSTSGQSIGPPPGFEFVGTHGNRINQQRGIGIMDPVGGSRNDSILTMESEKLIAAECSKFPQYARNSGSSSRSSFGPPPGFEERKWGRQDPFEGNKYLDRIEEMENKNQGKGLHDKRSGKVDNGKEQRAFFTLHISNISIGVPREEVLRCCSVFGTVEGLSMYKSYKILDTRFCFVRYKKKEEAEVAARRLRGTRRLHRFWNIGWARKDETVKQGGSFEEEIFKGAERVDYITGVTNKEIVEVLKRSWMLVMEKQRSIEDIRRIIENKELQVTTLVRWGLYGVIAVSKDDEGYRKWERSISDLERCFVKVGKVEIDRKIQPRYCWIEVKGIPVQAWSIESMENVASTLGNLIALDKVTAMAERMDVARLFIETEEIEGFNLVKHMKFQEEIFNIRIMEIEKNDDADCMLTQECCMGKQFISLENSNESMSVNSEKDDDWEDADLGRLRKGKVISLDVNVQGEQEGEMCKGNSHNPTGPTTVQRSEESGMQINETKVAETPASHVETVQREPVSQSMASRGKEKGVRASCSCCKNFKKHKEVGEIGLPVAECPNLNRVDEGINNEKVDDTIEVSNKTPSKRRFNGKKRSPRMRGQKGVKFAKLILKERIGKNNKKDQGRKVTKRNQALHLQESTSESGRDREKRDRPM